MATLHVEVLTPEAALWSGVAEALIARSSEGDFTILAQHTPVVGDLVPHVVRVQTEEGEKAFAVHTGFFQVGPDVEEGVTRATVLAGVAEEISSIDAARAQLAKEAAEARLSALKGEDEEAERSAAMDALARAELRLGAVAR